MHITSTLINIIYSYTLIYVFSYISSKLSMKCAIFTTSDKI